MTKDLLPLLLAATALLTLWLCRRTRIKTKGLFKALSVEATPAVPVGDPLQEGDTVLCIRWQIAECPIQEGYIYRVKEVDANGSVQFDECGRGHQPKYFRRVKMP